MFVCWKFILYNKKILGHVLCFQAKDLIDIFMTSFWISSLFLLVTISCVHPSLWIYIIMIVFYLESFTHERSYISNWYPLFFHVHRCFSFFSFWWLREKICFECVSYFPTSWCTLWPWRLFFLMLVLMRVLPFQLVSLLLTRFLLPIFTMGCHKRWFLFCLLVSLWTHFLVCVCGNDMSCTLYLISSRLCWWVMLILILVFSSALPWLTHITLVEPILKLLLLHVAQPFVLCNWYAYCLIYLLALVVCFY